MKGPSADASAGEAARVSCATACAYAPPGHLVTTATLCRQRGARHAPVCSIGLAPDQPFLLQPVHQLRDVRVHAGDALGQLPQRQRLARLRQRLQHAQLRQR